MTDRFEQFSFIISGIYRKLQKIKRDEMVKRGYKGAFAQYLATQSRYEEGLTSTELCEICDKDKAAVSRIIAEMEEKGLVQREKKAVRSYRSKITLTEKGKDVADFGPAATITGFSYSSPAKFTLILAIFSSQNLFEIQVFP